MELVEYINTVSFVSRLLPCSLPLAIITFKALALFPINFPFISSIATAASDVLEYFMYAMPENTEFPNRMIVIACLFRFCHTLGYYYYSCVA